MKYGDLGKRIIAKILDDLFIYGWFILLYSVLAVTVSPVGPYSYALVAFYYSGNFFVAYIVWAITVFLYYVLMEGGSWHATLGKRIMGLYIADGEGNGIKYSTSILRMIGTWISSILYIGYIMGFFNDQKQCLHDMIAKTYVLSGQPDDDDGLGYTRTKHVPKGGAQLVGISGPLAGMIYSVDEKGLLVGRDTVGCQVILPSSQAKVSRMHCYVTYNPISNMFVLNDRNSTHGTFLANGVRVSYAKPAALKSGDRFYLSTPDNMFEVR